MSTRSIQHRERAADADHAPVSAFRALNRWLGSIHIAAATALVTCFAVTCALSGAALLIENGFFGEKWQVYLGATAITVLIAAPIVYLALRVIRQLVASREALRQMTARLAWALDRAERASDEKSRFLATMSHELRTPLNAVIGFSDMIMNERLGPLQNQRYRDYAGDINGSGQHLLGIINEILDLAKIEAGEMRIDDDDICDVSEALSTAGRMIAPDAARRSVDLTVLPMPQRVQLQAADRMVRQVLINVLANAVKFTPAGGSVVLTPELRPHGNLVLAVTDSGIGMTADEIRVALTPFGQVGHAQRAENAGTGLGLPLARAMMELHGGRLTVRSTPGRGTTVVLIFPANRVLPAPPNVMPLNASATRSDRPPAAAGLNSADIIPLNASGPERSKHQP
ncbi:sensor histidine kinase [Marinibaculum pumilum]|uniref:histidine kinase n=1 Tax=Marinibaculum pumilum TaxID=1766165 RepID=A0ABV7KXD2_9PROT